MGASLLAFLNTEKGWPVAIVIVVIIFLGALVGVFNAFITVKIGVPSIVTTLGTSTLLAGLMLGICGPKVRSGISSSFVKLVRDKWFGLPHAFYFALLLTVVLWYVLRYTPLGRYLFFVGKGREVARLAGVRVDAIRFGSLVTTSIIATIAGLVLAGTTGSAQVGLGNSYLLPAYAAAFLGATAIRPGEFNAWGSWISVYFLITGITGLAIAGYSGWPEQVFYGGALVTAVVLAQLAARLRSRSEHASSRP
jgi:ribose transport system permease protein